MRQAVRGWVRRTFVRPPEHSPRLRWLTFAAQATGLLALVFVTRLWVVGGVSLLLLFLAHRFLLRRLAAVGRAAAPTVPGAAGGEGSALRISPPWLRLAIFTAFHLVFV